ncbi:RagB/SusD family nutrient uptake outer membrane protein [termite gut metagenome]|uniref:RagB/SusD family nutrient uptake outer membrane protein n=1 Tax=termite gut metagenome TaxID=433724 RepID=A0A5J4SAE6_9ZZZZ
MIQKYKFKLCAIISVYLGLASCVDLDQTPMTSLPGEVYFENETQLQTYVDNLYAPRTGDNTFDQIFDAHGTWSYGTFGIDGNTDNMATVSADNIWIPANYKVTQGGGDWSFAYIYKCNYFFNFVLPKYEAKTITGNVANINHLVGEVYFLRAYEYFKKLQKLGDFPIVTEMLPDDMTALTEASKRKPRTEVAHFILEDLDKAISLLNDDVAKTRITKKAALLLKSRVALYEGTWEKYFQNTAFVPNGPEWPGASSNSGYQFPKGSIDAEINFFLDEAMKAAKEVASSTPLVTNNGILPQELSDLENPYLKMYGDVNLSGYSEVILWKQYNRGLGITHNVCSYATAGCHKTGLTRGLVDNFLMEDGKPTYASSEYQGDDSLNCVRTGRDGRLQLFLKVPGDVNYYQGGGVPERCYNVIEPVPDVALGDIEKGYNTGYTLRKGYNPTFDQMNVNNGSYTGSIVFRAAEAYLNYIEACYEKNGSLDSEAKEYWVQIRRRANGGASVSWNDIETNTINQTVISKEILNDFGAYSAGAPLSDNTLYSIRRERRMELLAEGLRLADLKRWRALDQLINTPYHIEGCKFWGDNFHVYTIVELKDGTSTTTVARPKDNSSYFDGIVSPKSSSDYIRPYEIKPSDPVAQQGGLKWKMAHYLSPIAVDHLLITSTNGTDTNASSIYQNPFWPVQAEGIATR